MDGFMPDTVDSAAALEVASAYLTPTMLNHSRRVYAWAAALGDQQELSYDAELLFVAAMFHDLSLAPVFDSHTVAFEAAGGHLARVFATGAGWPGERRARLGDVIVRHMWPEVDSVDDPEGHVLSRAAALDVVGRNAEELDVTFRADLLRAYPRLGMVAEFLACFEDQAERKPESAAGRAVRSGLADRMAGNPLDAG
jgi:hypothetical protein